jgi:hypothetical protein
MKSNEPWYSLPTKIVLSNGDQYAASKTIFFDAHPAFHPDPAIMVIID